MYFKGRNWIFKTVCCIGCLVVCKIVFCSEFPDIPDKAGRKTTRRTQATAKRYVFHANAIIMKIDTNKIHNHFKGYVDFFFYLIDRNPIGNYKKCFPFQLKNCISPHSPPMFSDSKWKLTSWYGLQKLANAILWITQRPIGIGTLKLTIW